MTVCEVQDVHQSDNDAAMQARAQVSRQRCWSGDDICRSQQNVALVLPVRSAGNTEDMLRALMGAQLLARAGLLWNACMPDKHSQTCSTLVCVHLG